VRLRLGHHADDLRDDVPGALQHHAVADAHVEPGDLVGIVERGVGHDHAADRDRLQPRDRRQLAGAADLDVDRVQPSSRRAGPEICARAPSAAPWRPGPAGAASRAGRPCRRRRRCRTAGRRAALDRAIMIEQRLERASKRARSGEIGSPQDRRCAASARAGVSAGTSDASPQPWARKRSGRAAVIAGSSWRSDPAAALRGLAKVLPPALRLPLVERREVGLGHIDLAANLEEIGHRARRAAAACRRSCGHSPSHSRPSCRRRASPPGPAARARSGASRTGRRSSARR
jgi:hypothetical protein